MLGIWLSLFNFCNTLFIYLNIKKILESFAFIIPLSANICTIIIYIYKICETYSNDM